MLDDIRKPEAERREWIVEALKDENGMYTGYLHKGELVRCKECRYFIDNLTEDDTDEAYGECCFDWDIKMPTAEDFCSRGEREGE